MSDHLVPAVDRDGDAQWHLHDRCLLPILIRDVQPTTCLSCCAPANYDGAWVPLYRKEKR